MLRRKRPRWILASAAPWSLADHLADGVRLQRLAKRAGLSVPQLTASQRSTRQFLIVGLARSPAVGIVE